MTSSKSFTADPSKIAEDVWFLTICTHNKKWWIAK